MRKQLATLLAACTILAFCFDFSNAYATDLTVDTSSGAGFVAGYYGPYDPNRDMPPGGYPPTISPDLDPNAQVYFMGRTTGAPLSTGFTTPERRVAFLFDMSSVSIPSGEIIVDVSITLELVGGPGIIANFAGGHETVDFTSTPFFGPEILDPNSIVLPPDPNLPPVEELIWSTFGKGDFFGDFTIPDPNTAPTPPGSYDIPLPGSLGHVEDAILASDIFVVSARLGSYDPGPIGPGPGEGFPGTFPYEYAFGLTDVGKSVPYPVLTITTIPIPEPTTCGLGAIAVISCLLRRRSKH